MFFLTLLLMSKYLSLSLLLMSKYLSLSLLFLMSKPLNLPYLPIVLLKTFKHLYYPSPFSLSYHLNILWSLAPVIILVFPFPSLTMLPITHLIILRFPDPTSFAQENKFSYWRQEMLGKFTTLHRNQAWTRVPQPPNANIVGCKWVSI